jgi:replicative DNA helicase
VSAEDSTLYIAEQAVISAMLCDPDTAIARVKHTLSPSAFQAPPHRAMVTAIYALHAEGITVDPLTLTARMEKLGTLTAAGGKDYIGYVIDAVPTSANVAHHASIVRTEHDRRQAKAYLKNALAALEKGEISPREVAVQIQAEMLPIAVESDERGYRKLTTEHIRELLAEINERGERSRSGLTPGFATGYSAIDRETQGFRSGEFIVFGGVPKSMKSQMVINIALNAALRRDFVGIVSAEMTFSALLERMLASAALVPIMAMARGTLTDLESARIVREGGKLAGYMAIDDEGLPELSDVIARATDLKAQQPQMKLLVVDYIQLIQMKMAGRRGDEEINATTRALKKLGKRLELTVLAPSQANYKEVESRAYKRVELRDFQGASGMVQDGDFVFTIYNERQYDSEASPVLELSCKASRRTPHFTSYLAYEPNTLAILDSTTLREGAAA